MAVKAAAGYPQYSNNIITPMFSMDLLERFYCTTVFSDISTTEYSGELQKCGDQITFSANPKSVFVSTTRTSVSNMTPSTASR